MKSSIKIDFADLERGKGLEPVIVVKLIDSDDPRDKLLNMLFQNVGHTSESNKLLVDYRHQEQVANEIGLPSLNSTIFLYSPADTEHYQQNVNAAP